MPDADSRFVSSAELAHMPCVLGRLEGVELRHDGVWIVGTATARRRAVGVGGTRGPSPTAIEQTRQLVAQLAASGLVHTLVSGLAPGVDRAALARALDCGLPCIAVLPSGPDVYEDPEGARLAQRIVSGGGVLVSEQAPGTPVTWATRRSRDRLQIAMSDAVVVVASEPEGGSIPAARHALEAGVPVFTLDAGVRALVRGVRHASDASACVHAVLEELAGSR